jgi:hypothetical protein
MKSGALVVAGLLALGMGPAAALSQTQTETVVSPVIVTGDVIRFEPGKVLVVRNDGREIVYALTPSVAVPADVQVGRRVSVYSERGSDGNATVTRVTTTAITPDGQTKRTTEETRVGEDGTVRKSKVTTVNGEVVSYAPGRTIVVRRSGGEDMAYTITPSLSVPADVKVGQHVTLYTVPGPDGSTTVSRVTTTSITPEGQVKRTTEETRTQPSGETSKVTTVSVSGTVQAYEPGKSITVLRSDGQRVMYMFGDKAILPSDIVVGKTITIQALPVTETVILEKRP